MTALTTAALAPYRKMVMETITQIVPALVASDTDQHLEVRLVDGTQEQTMEDQVMLDGFGTVVDALGIRVKPYLTQIVSTILWRLNNKSAKKKCGVAANLVLPSSNILEGSILTRPVMSSPPTALSLTWLA
ncbi:hypothetical protein EDD15DRAFT_2521639 [Pisolithus albus]|nr:hypothetical protein EDD15DRAFT_2521639 [Pisolithus albus]